ncbi:hypothetical protein CURTO8I2_150061 [Curtobacterium sp. 8I-2]|nr:hypothetical protein CURTO8I2_150061 [Curtobacterium sp. 8I-2]
MAQGQRELAAHDAARPGVSSGSGAASEVCYPRVVPFAAHRPDSSVVEHLHGKEGVVSSILTRGSDPVRTPLRISGGVAQLVRAHDS